MRGATWQRLCAAVRALPGVEEGTSYSTPALRVRKKLLARLREDGEIVAVSIEPLDRDVLLEADPRAFFVTDHHLAYPFVLVRLADAQLSVVAELLEQAWRRAAPRRALAEQNGRRDVKTATEAERTRQSPRRRRTSG